MSNSTPDTPDVSESRLDKMKIAELREHARERGVGGADELHKPELLTKVKDHHYAQEHDGAHRPDTPSHLLAEAPSRHARAEDVASARGTHGTAPGAASSKRSQQIARSGPDVVEVRLPGLGTVRLSRPELAYVGGIVGLSVLGLVEWPIGLVIAGGHVLAADRSSRTLRDLGQAAEQA